MNNERTQMVAVATLAGLVILVTLAALGGLAFADHGGIMGQVMGHDAYTEMVSAMRGMLGDERADQMLAACDAAMQGMQADGGMGSMMGGGMGSMIGGMGR